MADLPLLPVEKRKVIGRKVKSLRRQDILPANIYGRGVKSLAVQTDLKGFQKLFSRIGTTGLVELDIKNETKKRPALIHNIQTDPVSDQPLHVDFYQVDLTKKVITPIPIELTGESPAVDKGGVLVQLIDELEVEALPADLPDRFKIDVSQLAEIGDHITAEKLEFDKNKVTLKLEDPKAIIVQIEEPAKEKEEKKEPEEAEEGAEPEEKEETGKKAEKTKEAPVKEEKKETEKTEGTKTGEKQEDK